MQPEVLWVLHQKVTLKVSFLETQLPESAHGRGKSDTELITDSPRVHRLACVALPRATGRLSQSRHETDQEEKRRLPSLGWSPGEPREDALACLPLGSLCTVLLIAEAASFYLCFLLPLGL